MRTASILRALLVPGAALLIAACGRADARETTVTDDLQRDLDLAQASTLELAPAGTPSLTVSPLERTPDRAPSTASRVSTGRRPRPAPVPVAVPDAEPEVAVAPEPTVETETPTDAPSIDLVEASLPPVVASTGRVGEGDRGAGGGIIGAIGGVVIRGGGVGMGDDDCEIHPRRGRGIPPGGVLGPVIGSSGVLVNRRMPRGAGRPTF